MVAGRPGALAVRTSVTKKGLPPVRAWTASESTGRPAAIVRTAWTESLGRETADRRRGGEVAEDDAQGMARPEFVVAEGDDEECPQIADPAAEKAEQVETRPRRPNAHLRRRGSSVPGNPGV